MIRSHVHMRMLSYGVSPPAFQIRQQSAWSTSKALARTSFTPSPK